LNTHTNKDHIATLPFFFILGRPRSGTTLLSTLFDAHPKVMLPFECALIINLCSKYGKIKTWDKKRLVTFYNDIITQRKFDSWRVEKDKLKMAILSCEGDVSFQTLIKIVYTHFNSFFKKEDISVVGDKNPIYSIYPDRLIKLFPDAKFIHLTRDYRDNILSLKKVDFEAPITTVLAYRWRYATKKTLKSKERFPAKFFTIKYEELVTDPEDKLNEICNFLNIDYNHDLLDFYKKKEELLNIYSLEEIEKYHKSLLNPISNSKVESWRVNMKQGDIQTSDMIVGKYAELSGYTRRYKMINPLRFLIRLPALCYGYISFQSRFVTDKLPFTIKNRIRNRGPILANIYCRLIDLIRKQED